MRLLARTLLTLGLVTLAASTTGASKPPLGTTAQVDLQRYMGRWWVIANIPYFAENGKVATADVYTLRQDGRIDNVFAYRRAFGEPEKRMSGVATVVAGTGNAQWRIAFFGGWVKADYLILEVAPDYSWALIGHPSRTYAWLLARDQQLDAAKYAELVGRFAAYGYDTTQIKPVPQVADLE